MVWMFAAAAYLVGAVPFAHLVARGLAGVDVRRTGSGNVGATNVARTAGAPLAALALALDAGKGAAAVLAAGALGADEAGRAAAAAAVVVGHVWPVWLRFHGGRGVAPAAGAFAVLAPAATAAVGVLFALVVSLGRYVSLGSVLAAAALPWLALATGAGPAATAAAWGVAGLIVARHHANLRRLWCGAEPKLAFRRRA